MNARISPTIISISLLLLLPVIYFQAWHDTIFSLGTTPSPQDRQAIDDTIARYAIALDKKNLNLLSSVFTPTVKADYSSTIPDLIVNDLPALQAALGDAVAGYTTQHFTNTMSVKTLRKGRAEALTYLRCTTFLDSQEHVGQVAYFYGYYEDQLVKLSEGWRIAERVFSPFGSGPAGNVSIFGSHGE